MSKFDPKLDKCVKEFAMVPTSEKSRVMVSIQKYDTKDPSIKVRSFFGDAYVKASIGLSAEQARLVGNALLEAADALPKVPAESKSESKPKRRQGRPSNASRVAEAAAKIDDATLLKIVREAMRKAS